MVKPPIIVKAEGDVFVFDDVNAVERYVEPYDVEDGVYDQVFDADGKALDFVVEQGALLRRGPTVRLVEGEISATHGDDLARLLRGVLGYRDDDARPLAQLVKEASAKFRQE